MTPNPGVLITIGRYAWEDARESWLREEGVWQRDGEIFPKQRGNLYDISLPLLLAEDLMDHCALHGWGKSDTSMDIQKRYRTAAESIKFQLATQTGKTY